MIRDDANLSFAIWSKPFIWSGIKTFSGFNVFNNNIIIKVGSQLIFDKNATVKISGKVTYHKNWRYSIGGSILLDSCLFRKNNKNATVGKKSRVTINHSAIDTPNNFEQKSLYKNKIIISNKNMDLYDFKHPLFSNKETLINKNIFGNYQ